MQFAALVFCLLPAVLAAPATDEPAGSRIVKRQGSTAVTDQLLFDLSLPAFITRRNNRDPANLDWSADGCSQSPDNPLGFNFEPACFRHDFGYRNYKKQNRFNESNRKRIDDNFKDDLYFQCDSEGLLEVACNALAEVYYTAVRLAGGSKKRSEDGLVEDYDKALVRYYEVLEETRQQGLIPA